MSIISPVLFSSIQGKSAPVGFESTSKPRFTTCGRYEIHYAYGFGILNGTAFSTIDELVPLLTNVDYSPERLIDNLEGNVAVAYRDLHSNRSYVVTDRFGGGKVFYHKSDGQWVLSSSLPDLINVLGHLGINVEKSIENTALLAFVGYGGGAVESPWTGISVLDQFTYVELRPERLVEHPVSDLGKQLGIGNWNLQNNDHLLEQAASEILQNVSAYSRYSADNFICHLTGGLDSRTVFAAVVGSGHADRYKTHTYGMEESADVQIGRKLTAQYGLKATTYSGMRFRLTAPTPSEQKLWTLRQTGGLTSMTPASIGAHPVPDAVVLAGGWGEMYRGGYPDHPEAGANREDLVKWIVNWILRSGSPYGTRIAYGGLFSDAMVERARSYAAEVLNEIDSFQIPIAFLPEWLYLRWSTRFNVAEITRSCLPFVHRADPLNIRSMMQLIFATRFEERRNGGLQLDLIHALERDLAFFPLDKDDLTTGYAASRGASVLQFSADISNVVEPTFSDPSFIVQKTGAMPRVTTQQREEALRLKMPLRFVANAESQREQIKLAVNEHPEVMAKVFNLKALKNVTNRNPNTRPEYRRLETLSAALSWHFD